MKNKFRGALLMTALISMSILACKKKSTEEPPQQSNCETKYEVRYGESTSSSGTASVNYENGQIISLNADVKLNYEYSTDRISVSAAGKPLYRIDVVNKLAVRITDLTSPSEERLTYDANQNLVKIESYFNNNLEDTQTLTYSNGNLTSLTQTFSSDPSVKKVTVYNYSTEVANRVDQETRNLFFGVVEPILPSSFVGLTTKNVLTSSLYTYTSGNFRSDITKTYTYTRTGNGILNKVVEDSHTLTVSNGIQTQNERTKKNISVNSTCN